ncbi:actin-related protein 2/3 complex subunit 5 [Paraphysoderma sedebokerense]|nr:actin-related protein 2/3 complex subunit 5 [Paraphysoderma sedebokerense]KAI9140883.1 actin-related protein 2/3 complex subunit 5 [Paraphysoderma sedebokerense]
MAHRKVDVDSMAVDDDYDDENAAPESAAAVDVHLITSQVDSRAAEVSNLIQRGQASEAVLKALDNPPYGSDSINSAKDKNTRTVIDALSAAKSADIPSIIKKLSVEQCDVLMKYLYKGFATPEVFNTGVLLAWHEKLTEVAGVGSIVRVMADRRTV